MRDNSGENKSKEIMDFFHSVGVRNHFSTSQEQWQNGLAEAAFHSIMRLTRTVMAESGDSGSRQLAPGRMPATSPTSNGWGLRPTPACTLKLKTF